MQHAATAILLNWNRPHGMKYAIAKLKRQTVPIEIFLWNNNPRDKTRYDVDMQINSSNNLYCWPRWLIANFSNCQYIFSHDDDLYIQDEDTIRQCIDYLSSKPDDTIIGHNGARLNGMNYEKSEHFSRPKMIDIKVDVIKGRFMFMRKQLLNCISILHELSRGDDIHICSHSSNKIIPAFLKDKLIDLSSHINGLCTEPDHMALRDKATAQYFGDNKS